MTPDLSSRLPSTSTSAGIREERTSKAFSDEHHGPGDARERHRAMGSPWGEMRRCAEQVCIDDLVLRVQQQQRKCAVGLEREVFAYPREMRSMVSCVWSSKTVPTRFRSSRT